MDKFINKCIDQNYFPQPLISAIIITKLKIANLYTVLLNTYTPIYNLTLLSKLIKKSNIQRYNYLPRSL